MGLFDSVTLHFSQQGFSIDLQPVRGLATMPTVLIQSFQDDMFFERIHRFLQASVRIAEQSVGKVDGVVGNGRRGSKKPEPAGHRSSRNDHTGIGTGGTDDLLVNDLHGRAYADDGTQFISVLE